MRLLPEDDVWPKTLRRIQDRPRRDRRLAWVFFLIPLAVSVASLIVALVALHQ